MAQAGAGSLLLSVSGAELFLGVWSAGFWARTAVVVLAVAGVTVLACGLAPLASRAKAPFPIDE